VIVRTEKMKKKFLLLIMLLFAFFSFVSCENTNKSKTYDIIYMSKGSEITHSPSTYVSGERTTLLPLEDTLTERFVGWYLSDSFDGEMILEIDESSEHNIVLFAKWEKKDETQNSLEKALLNLNSYAFSYLYKDANDTLLFSSFGEFYNGSTKTYIEFDDGTTGAEYLASVDGMLYYYGLNEDNTYYSISEDDPFFDDYTAYFDTVYLDQIAASLFIEDDGKYQLIDKSRTHEVTKQILGEFIGCTYSDITLEVKDEVISSLSVKLSGSTTYHITVEFSSHNKSSFTLPEVEPLKTTITCDELSFYDNGDTVSVEGVVSGIVGNNFYIESKNKGVYIYCGSTNEALSSLSLGTSVVVTGVKATYKGLVELEEISDIRIIKETQISPLELTTTNNETLTEMVGRCVAFKELIVKTTPSNTSTKKDTSLTVSDGTNDATLFISKYLDDDTFNTVISILTGLEKGSKINLENAVVGMYNTPQLVVTAQTKITIASGEVTDVKITTKNKITVKENVPFFEAVENLAVTLIRSDGSVVILNSDEYTFDYSNYAKTEGSYEITIIYNDLKTTFIIEVTNTQKSPFRTDDDTERLSDVIKKMGKGDDGTIYGLTRGLPSTGNPKVLVIPVSFSDYTADKDMVENLKQAFFGDALTTKWESLRSYYLKSSYNKLDITGEVLPVFETNKKSSYYESMQNGDYEIIKAALTYYDSMINYDDFDSDKDGYIDAIYLVYTCPINYVDSDSMYWAYTYEYSTDEIELYDNVEADFYLFAGYDFLFETPQSGASLKYNLETFIHETGHLLGLDDYYDYDTSTGPAGGAGGGDMMDNNVGDHNAFTKAILGWINPLVMDGDKATITLNSFEASGDAIIIAKNYEGSLFTEYFIIDFYTPTGLNEMEKGNSGLFSTVGIRIYHIDATLQDASSAWSVWDIYKYNNANTSHKLISLVEADGNSDITKGDEYGSYAENSDLFKENSVWKTATWYDGTSAGFTLTVDEITGSAATITISFN